MNTSEITEITNAIARSVSHNEIVRVTVSDLDAAYTEVSAQTDECDQSTENDGSLDVYGTTDAGGEFRLRLIPAGE